MFGLRSLLVEKRQNSSGSFNIQQGEGRREARPSSGGHFTFTLDWFSKRLVWRQAEVDNSVLHDRCQTALPAATRIIHVTNTTSVVSTSMCRIHPQTQKAFIKTV
ncbi:hypothetical protein J6590_031159 [Homalodisca vitripennis]|nr:hypothetical protein J6590_031159 [Homalodisca vitripennis]